MYPWSDGVQTVAWHRLARTKVDKDKRDHLVVRTEAKALTTNSQQEDGADQFPVRLWRILFNFLILLYLDQLVIKVRYRLSSFSSLLLSYAVATLIGKCLS